MRLSRIHLFAVLLLALVIATACSPFTTYQNPLVTSNSPDPGAIWYNGNYYVVTTSLDEPNSFPIRRSSDLVQWTELGFVFPIGRRPTWAVQDFWAPELHHINGSFVVYFTARDTTGVLCIGRAESQSIEGPYKDLGLPMIRNASGMGSIDATAFYSEQQQQLYMIWKEDGNAVGLPTPIWAQAMDPRGLMLTGTRTMILVNDLPWEGPLVEAPWIIKRGNWYYLFYSANSYFNGNYCVGVARSHNILGPFKKWPQPILHTAAGNWIGPGHCSVIPLQGTTDHWMMIYHSWKEGHVGGADDSRMLLMDSIVWDSTGWPSIPNNSPSIKPQQIPSI